YGPMQKRHLLWFIFILVTTISCSRDDNPLPVGNGKVLVLMYHSIVDGAPANEYERTVDKFEGDLRYIRDNNINVLLFSDLENIAVTGEMPVQNSIILTFDDGDRSWYTLVKPLLLKYGMKATFFLCTDMVGSSPYVNWDEVEEMSGYMQPGGVRPFEFESHTTSHRFLLASRANFGTETEYNAFLDYEFGESKKLIDGHILREITALSLPYGDGADDPVIIAAATRNGYSLIRTSKWGNITSPEFNLFSVPSLPVLDTTSVRFINYYLNL
ncbi:MAG: polysaccharide deacetylase family protein, partial [Bacteroidales bacterium]